MDNCAQKDLPAVSFVSRIKSGYGIMVEATLITLAILTIRLTLDHYNVPFIPINAWTTAFLAGVFFTIGIIFTGAISDYKEAERIPSDLAVSIKTLYKDTTIIPIKPKNKQILIDMRENVKSLLTTINNNFRRDLWMLGDMNKEINKIDENIAALGQVGVATNILIKLRNELSNIDRMCHRVSTMIQTSFIPAAYTISTVSVGSVIILSLLTKTDFQYGGPLITIMVSIVLVSLLLLMDDMDDPFDYRRKVYASVDLSQLIHLEEHWKNGEF